MLFSVFFLVIDILQSIYVGIFAFITASLYIVVRLVGSKNLLLELRMFGSILIGFILSLLILSSIFSYFGWWQSYLSTTLEFTSSIAGINLPNGQGLPVIAFNKELLSPIHLLKTVISRNALFYISFGVLVIFSFITLIRLTFKKAKTTDTIAFLVSVFSILIYFSIIGRSGHYFIIVPFLIVLGAYLLTLVKGFWRILFLILFGIYFIRHFTILRYDIFTNFYSVKYQQTIDKVSPFQTTLVQGTEIALLQKHFALNVGKEQQIYVLNNAPALYFLLDRKNATKFDLPLLAGTLEKRLETVEVLKAKTPLVIEYVNAWAVDGVSDRSRQPEVFQFVDMNYIVKNRVGPFTLYVFKQSRN